MNPFILLKSFAAGCGTSSVSLGSLGCGATNLPQVSASSNEIQKILQITFMTLGAVAVLFVVIGGFRYVISSGDPEDAANARKTIIYAIIGLIVALAAEAIVTFALSFLNL